MQLFALLTLVSAAVATPARRQLGMPGVNATESGSCTRYSAPRTCSIAGDRNLICFDSQKLCQIYWTSPNNVTDIEANQQACEGKEDGDACTVHWTCCPSS